MLKNFSETEAREVIKGMLREGDTHSDEQTSVLMRMVHFKELFPDEEQDFWFLRGKEWPAWTAQIKDASGNEIILMVVPYDDEKIKNADLSFRVPSVCVYGLAVRSPLAPWPLWETDYSLICDSREKMFLLPSWLMNKEALQSKLCSPEDKLDLVQVSCGGISAFAWRHLYQKDGKSMQDFLRLKEYNFNFKQDIFEDNHPVTVITLPAGCRICYGKHLFRYDGKRLF